MNSSSDRQIFLKSALEVGLSVQAVSVVTAFCIKHEKAGILAKLKEFIAAFEASLTDDERNELAQDMEAMMREKAERLVDELEATHTQEEIDELVSELRGSVPAQNPLGATAV